MGIKIKFLMLGIWFCIAGSLCALDYTPGILLVKLESGVNIESVIWNLGDAVKSHKYIRTVFKPNAQEDEKLCSLKFDDATDMKAMAKRVGEFPGVKWAEPNYMIDPNKVK